MRKTALLLVIAVFHYAAYAQFTLRPQAGIENPLTKISYNNLAYFKPVGQLVPQAGVRADYQFKGGFGPFLGLFTHRPLVSYNFEDPENGMTVYNASKGDLQLQLQAGMQYSTKPLRLSGKPTSAKPKTEDVSEVKTGCHRYSLGCCRKKTPEAQQAKPQNTWTVRLQPSAGIGYVPSGKEDVETLASGTSASYTYNAGNIKTEWMAGMGFEFAHNNNRILTLSVNYFQGLGNNETQLTTQSATGKTVVTSLNSKVSGWNATLGIPISFAKKNTTVKSQQTYHSRCGEYYKKRCGSYSRLQ